MVTMSIILAVSIGADLVRFYGGYMPLFSSSNLLDLPFYIHMLCIRSGCRCFANEQDIARMPGSVKLEMHCSVSD